MSAVVRGDAGVSGALDVTIAIGLVMMPMVMLVASLPRWIETRSMAELAAQEAARAVVLADAQTSWEAIGEAAARRIAENNGVDGASIEVTFAGSLAWGQEVTASVTVAMPVLTIPLIGTFSAGRFTTHHIERVDDYRSFQP